MIEREKGNKRLRNVMDDVPFYRCRTAHGEQRLEEEWVAGVNVSLFLGSFDTVVEKHPEEED